MDELETRICYHCGNEFTREGNHAFCEPSCAEEFVEDFLFNGGDLLVPESDPLKWDAEKNDWNDAVE